MSGIYEHYDELLRENEELKELVQKLTEQLNSLTQKPHEPQLYRFRPVESDFNPKFVRGSRDPDELKEYGYYLSQGHGSWFQLHDGWVLKEYGEPKFVIEPVNPEPYDPTLEPDG